MSVYGAPTIDPSELNGGRRRHNARERVSFEYAYELNKQESARQGKPVKRRIELTIIEIPGEQRRKVETTEEHHARWPAEYKAFKEGEEAPETGFPLRDWPIMDRSTVEDLKAVGFHTVEQLADPTQTGFKKLGALSTWAKEAKRFLEAREGGPARIAALETQVEELTRQNASLEEQVITLCQRLDAETGTALVDRTMRDRLTVVRRAQVEPVKEISATPPTKRTRSKSKKAAEVALGEPT